MNKPFIYSHFCVFPAQPIPHHIVFISHLSVYKQPECCELLFQGESMCDLALNGQGSDGHGAERKPETGHYGRGTEMPSWKE